MPLEMKIWFGLSLLLLLILCHGYAGFTSLKAVVLKFDSLQREHAFLHNAIINFQMFSFMPSVGSKKSVQMCQPAISRLWRG